MNTGYFIFLIRILNSCLIFKTLLERRALIQNRAKKEMSVIPVSYTHLDVYKRQQGTLHAEN